MANMTFLLCWLFVLLLGLSRSFAVNKPLTLLISFDGFRWNYLSRTSTPNFDELINTGVKAKWLHDVFVSVTYPNHYTLVTGLYGESHGIVANRFYDPNLKQSFDYRTNTVLQSKWWGGEPVWVTSELQGKKAGVFFWVGSQAAIKGIRPTAWMEYDSSYPWPKRVDRVVDWLANKPVGKDSQPLNISLALLYFFQPDHYGHLYGPESNEVTQMIGQCDNITGYLIRQLKANGLYDKVNIIITSDHGMTTVTQSRTVPIFPHVNLEQIDYIINYGAGAGIWPKEGLVDVVYQGLQSMNSHVKVWKKEDIPKQFHYSNNDRIPPIVLMPDDGWFLVNKTNDKIPMNGDHGYNNSLMDMHQFFIAHGPAFKQGYVSEPFSSVNVYELVCHITGLKPAPNNGSFDAIKHLLKPYGTLNANSSFVVAKYLSITIGVVLALMVIIFIIFHYQQGRHKGYTWIEGDTIRDDV